MVFQTEQNRTEQNSNHLNSGFLSIAASIDFVSATNSNYIVYEQHRISRCDKSLIEQFLIYEKMDKLNSWHSSIYLFIFVKSKIVSVEMLA